MLAQTEKEMQMTYFGLMFLGFFLFMLILDSMAKGKILKKKSPLKNVILVMVIIIAIVLISIQFIYK